MHMQPLCVINSKSDVTPDLAPKKGSKRISTSDNARKVQQRRRRGLLGVLQRWKTTV